MRLVGGRLSGGTGDHKRSVELAGRYLPKPVI